MDQQLCSGNSDNRATQLARHQQLCSGDSPDNRAMQLARRRERDRNRRASESLETRERRLARDRARRRQCVASESAEERETRLSRRRARDRQWRAARSSQARQARLQQMTTSNRARIAAETPEETEARLQQMRTSNQARTAAETPEETEARLCQDRLSHQRRIAAETPEETEARLCQARLSQQRRRCPRKHWLVVIKIDSIINSTRDVYALQHYLQPAVTTKMNRFHSGIAALQVSTCVTCMERFPGMTVRMTSAGTECVRCFRDKYSPKAYSSQNNMHPGPVPQELMVRYNIWLLAGYLNFYYLVVSLSAGAHPSRGDANLSSYAHHVSLQTASRTVWVLWPYCQPAPGCRFLCPESAKATF